MFKEKLDVLEEWNYSNNDSTGDIELTFCLYHIDIIDYLLDLLKEETVIQFYPIKICLVIYNTCLICHRVYQIYIKYLIQQIFIQQLCVPGSLLDGRDKIKKKKQDKQCPWPYGDSLLLVVISNMISTKQK